MFQELLELLKRFVAAQEKQAVAAMLMAQPQPCRCSTPTETTGQPDGTECTAATGEKPGQTPPALTAWDPYTSPIQGRYGKDKIEVLDAELKATGISIKSSATGAEKHQALLDHGNSSTPPAAPAEEPKAEEPKAEEPKAEEPKAEEPKAEEPTTPATIDDVRTLAQEAVKGGMAPAQVQDIFESIGGSRRLPEIEEQHMPAIHAKLTAAMKAVNKG